MGGVFFLDFVFYFMCTPCIKCKYFVTSGLLCNARVWEFVL